VSISQFLGENLNSFEKMLIEAVADLYLKISFLSNLPHFCRFLAIFSDLQGIYKEKQGNYKENDRKSC